MVDGVRSNKIRRVLLSLHKTVIESLDLHEEPGQGAGDLVAAKVRPTRSARSRWPTARLPMPRL